MELAEFKTLAKNALALTVTLAKVQTAIEAIEGNTTGGPQYALDALGDYASDQVRTAGVAYMLLEEKPEGSARIEAAVSSAGISYPQSHPMIALTLAYLDLPGVRSTEKAVLGPKPKNAELAVAYDTVLEEIAGCCEDGVLPREAATLFTGPTGLHLA